VLPRSPQLSTIDLPELRLACAHADVLATSPPPRPPPPRRATAPPVAPALPGPAAALAPAALLAAPAAPPGRAPASAAAPPPGAASRGASSATPTCAVFSAPTSLVPSPHMSVTQPACRSARRISSFWSGDTRANTCREALPGRARRARAQAISGARPAALAHTATAASRAA